MRESSTTCTVTVQPLFSSGSSPRTESTGWPSNAGSSPRTHSTASRAEIRPRAPLRAPFWLRLERCSAIVGLLRRVRVAGLAHGQPLQQRFLSRLAFVVVDQPVLDVEFQLQQLATDAVLVVELTLDLLRHLLCDPCDAAHRRQWKHD